MTSPRTDDFAAVERRPLRNWAMSEAVRLVRRDARRRYLELTDKDDAR